MPTVYDFVYAAAGLAGAPWILSAFRSRPELRATLRPKLGACRPRRGDRPCLWLHGVSVGEVVAGKIFAAEFTRRHPSWDVICTTTTVTGHAAARQAFGADRVRYFPYDFSGPVERVFAAIRPSMLVLMELEIWPNVMTFARRRGVPVAIVNGRVTARALARYRCVRPLVASAWQGLSACAVQNETMRDRFRELGAPPARTAITGNVKFDAADTPPPSAPDARILAVLGDARRPLCVAGSTHDPEEAALLRVMERLRAKGISPRLVLVPRHPARAEAVVAAVAAAGRRPLRKSALDAGTSSPPGDDGVLIVDTIGDLRSFYSVADVVFVGGSLIPHGGQNCLEPAALGKPVVCGPSMQNFEDAIDLLEHAQGAYRVPDEATLEVVLGNLLRDGHAAQTAGELARRAVAQARGATSKTLDFLSPIVENARLRAARPGGRALS